MTADELAQNLMNQIESTDSNPVEKFKCQYCDKEFRKLTTLGLHSCEKKRRAKQENETGVRFGFQAYIQFYTAAQGSAKSKTYDDFSASPYYGAFVKYGQYLVQIRAINVPMFTKWLLDQNKKLDHWTKEANYDEYLYDYLRKEHPNDAIERSFTEMQRWADDTDNQFNDIFRKGTAGKVCVMLENGRISPWAIFHCQSGIDLLSSLNDEQASRVIRWIDPTYWEKRFQALLSDTELTKSILAEAGL
jgi:hypothetical protein